MLQNPSPYCFDKEWSSKDRAELLYMMGRQINASTTLFVVPCISGGDLKTIYKKRP